MKYAACARFGEAIADQLPNRPGNGYERLGFIYETPTSDSPLGASRSGGFLPRWSKLAV